MTSWFRDYVYFSLGGSRCAPWRHYLNIVIVFVCSGLWHGADWRYLAWGLFTGLLAAFGVMTARARQIIKRYNPLYRMGWFKVFWQCLFTVCRVRLAFTGLGRPGRVVGAGVESPLQQRH